MGSPLALQGGPSKAAKGYIFSIVFRNKELYFFKNSNRKGSPQKRPLINGQNQLFLPPVLAVALLDFEVLHEL